MHVPCNAITNSGNPCKGRSLPGRSYCISHDPEFADRRAEGQRKGGEQRSNARRAAKQWAAIGEQVSVTDLPAILKACMFSVKSGAMEPAQASAITGLAKAAVSISNEIDLEARIAAPEQAAGINQGSGIRRVK